MDSLVRSQEAVPAGLLDVTQAWPPTFPDSSFLEAVNAQCEATRVAQEFLEHASPMLEAMKVARPMTEPILFAQEALHMGELLPGLVDVRDGFIRASRPVPSMGDVAQAPLPHRAQTPERSSLESDRQVAVIVTCILCRHPLQFVVEKNPDLFDVQAGACPWCIRSQTSVAQQGEERGVQRERSVDREGR